jgi:anaerobic glycerol-3-phosphate dehydrogenase
MLVALLCACGVGALVALLFICGAVVVGIALVFAPAVGVGAGVGALHATRKIAKRRHKNFA